MPNLNALENVMVPLLCHDVNLSDYKEKALGLLSELGLSERAMFSVEQLSGGQQQRVAVARALITEPKIVIADEPLTFVDDLSAQKIISSFNKLRDQGKTIIISPHLSGLSKTEIKYTHGCIRILTTDDRIYVIIFIYRTTLLKKQLTATAI